MAEMLTEITKYYDTDLIGDGSAFKLFARGRHDYQCGMDGCRSDTPDGAVRYVYNYLKANDLMRHKYRELTGYEKAKKLRVL
jgi:hypothetical protein